MASPNSDDGHVQIGFGKPFKDETKHFYDEWLESPAAKEEEFQLSLKLDEVRQHLQGAYRHIDALKRELERVRKIAAGEKPVSPWGGSRVDFRPSGDGGYTLYVDDRVIGWIDKFNDACTIIRRCNAEEVYL